MAFNSDQKCKERYVGLIRKLIEDELGNVVSNVFEECEKIHGMHGVISSSHLCFIKYS